MALPEGFSGKAAQVAEQLLVWQVLGQIIAPLLAPLVNEITRAANQGAQTVPLPPAALADMVVRNIVSAGEGEAYAKQSGIAPSDFARLTAAAGDAPSPQELVQALRRQLIPAEGRGPDSLSFQQGIAEGRLRDKWEPIIRALGDLPIGPADAVDAVVEGQISYEQGQREAFLNGVDAERFKILVDTRGRPPDPTQLNELHRKGLIPLEGVGPDALSVQQGIFEGATKDKWWRLLAALSEYVPPPRTVTAMVREGSLTDAQALQLYGHAGLSQELATAYLTSAHHQRTATARNLTVAAITQLYEDRIIDQQAAGDLLLAMRYSQQDAQLELELADFRVEQAALRSAVSRLQTLFVNHKLDATQASAALDGYHVPPRARDQLLRTWQQEAAANVKVLSTADIVGAVKYGYLTFDQGVGELRGLGYDERDARIHLGVGLHVPVVAAP